MIRDAEPEDAEAIAAIYNDAALNSTTFWNATAVDAADRRAWIAARGAAGLPVLVLEEGGAVLGYASYGPFRPQEGFRGTVENSVYLAEGARGGGRGRALMEQLIAYARAAEVHAMVAAVDAANLPSIRLHEKLGFQTIGTLPQVGQKFGTWLDLTLLQLTLDDRAGPDQQV